MKYDTKNMNQIKKRANYYIVFTFAHYDDIISYFTSRQCTDLRSMIDYCDKIDEVLEYKYGKLLETEIYERKDDVYLLVYDNVEKE